MEIVRTKDTGTLQYEIFFNDDETEAMVFERYRDIDAALEHFSHISHLMADRSWRRPRSRDETAGDAQPQDAARRRPARSCSSPGGRLEKAK